MSTSQSVNALTRQDNDAGLFLPYPINGFYCYRHSNTLTSSTKRSKENIFDMWAPEGFKAPNDSEAPTIIIIINIINTTLYVVLKNNTKNAHLRSASSLKHLQEPWLVGIALHHPALHNILSRSGLAHLHMISQSVRGTTHERQNHNILKWCHRIK